jgi:thiosulfate/3-mercaptopyruvate sulfurtransferase
MTGQTLPLILEPEQLEAHLDESNLLVIDLSKAETYRQLHVPGAVHLDYTRIVQVRKPIMGLLPDDAHLGDVLGGIGLTPESRVVAYDDEGGGKAARLLWTLDVLGHQRFSLLNGGLHAWANEGHTLEHRDAPPDAGHYLAHHTGQGFAAKDYVLTHLRDPAVALLDTRSPEEYCGTKRLAERGGHIPGAVNMDWVRAMDNHRNLRLLPAEQLRALLEPLGVTVDKEVIVYCHSHHRSAHTYIVLKSLGYNVRGYAGAWSEWGNDPALPVET